MNNKTEEVFFELVRAGLWEQNIKLAPYGEIDYAGVFRMAESQLIVGLVAAGLEHIEDMKAP